MRKKLINMTESEFNESLTEDVKTFKDLKEEIIDSGECCSCGACVAYCESQSFDVIDMYEDIPQFKSSKNEENCTECGLCYFICPQTEPLLDLIMNKNKARDELGQVLEVIAAKTSDKAIAEVGQDGGIITTILNYLFLSNKIDAAIVSEHDESMKPIPKIIFDRDELLKSAGTRYTISPNILALKEIYNLSSDIMKQKEIYDIDQLRVAFVGTPCQCRAIDKMKYLSVKPAHVIKYVIGLFCFENFYYEKLVDTIKKETDLAPSKIKKTVIKKNFFVIDENEEKFEINIKKFDECVRDHCHICDEFTAKYTDVSVGASGAPEGYSIVLVRTKKGSDLMRVLLSLGYIEEYLVPAGKKLDWKQKKLDLYRKMISYKTK
ncbi:MAG: hypothetical protein GF383_00825 [Candidatus Lokiarchaeota archaeon]|nr:hypothetical protein [Candidatus Lokiarchaeota archaeon]MBD3337729.1 hypothetical protein [Candidatus Lokiarchaeota archaeon]